MSRPTPPPPRGAARWRNWGEFPGGEAGFRDRLLREALATKLQMPAVAGFRPGLLQAAQDKLSGRPRTMAVWDDWVAGRGDLRELLQARLADPATMRAEIRAMRSAGLDPARLAAAAPPPPGGGVLAVGLFGRASARIFCRDGRW